MRAIGYHGTSVRAARRILSSGFEISRNAYDWLGDGAYFFQDAPARALEWARERFGEDAAVVGAEIDREDCVDLLDVRWHTVVQEAYADLVRRLKESARPLPRQTSGAHRLDRDVIKRTVERLRRRGILVRTVRAAFLEGEPLFPDSALWTRTHVQNRRARSCRDPSVVAIRIAKRGIMLDPETARAVLREYHATATDQEIVEDLRRDSPELAKRLGVDIESVAVRKTPRTSMRGALGTFRRSVLRLFT